MQFSCEKVQLLQAVATASRTVASKSAIQSLEGLLIEAGNGLHISGYDLKTGIRTCIPAEVKEPGSVVLNARLLGEIIRKAPDDVVTVTCNERLMTKIDSGASVFNIIGMPAADFPELPTVDRMNSLTIAQKTLKSMIAQTNFAVSDNESRPIHTGELFEVENGILNIVAVDGYRLALRREKYASADSESMKFVVPGTALSEVEKIMGDTEDTVGIFVGQKHILFSMGDTELVSRRLEGEFLNYRNSIPKTGKFSVDADRRDVIQSVERVSLIISDKLKSPVRCVFDENMLHISSSSALGKASDSCIVEGDGENLEIGFNNKYLLDALRASPSDRIRIQLSSGVTPCVIVPAGEEKNFICMILPVRLKANEG